MVSSYGSGNTNADNVRMLIGDTDIDSAIFNDSEISNFLSLEDNNVFTAAALALNAMANNQLLVLKVMKIMDVQTDGAAVARELRFQAIELRKRDAEGVVEIAEIVTTDFQYRERIHKQRQRGVV